jgi:phosphatidate cytidylyltransferase
MKRVLTAIIAIPIVLAITLFASDRIFAIAVGLVAAGAAEEFLSLGARRGMGRPGKWFFVPVALVAASFVGGTEWVLTSMVASSVALLTVGIFAGSSNMAMDRAVVGLAAIVYCGLTLGYLILLPRELVLFLFAIIWIGDSAAFYLGKALGRHRLAPTVSPKKTIEGAVAGLVASTVSGVILGVSFLGQPWVKLLLISGAVAIAGQIGDLAESALKRSAMVKNSSSILPGHGGILDRLDSLFFAAPIFYWLFNA